MQLGAGGGNPVKAAKLVYGEAGMPGMYAGLSAAITRQAVYTTLRVGLYDWLRVREENLEFYCKRVFFGSIVLGSVC